MRDTRVDPFVIQLIDKIAMVHCPKCGYKQRGYTLLCQSCGYEALHEDVTHVSDENGNIRRR